MDSKINYYIFEYSKQKTIDNYNRKYYRENDVKRFLKNIGFTKLYELNGGEIQQLQKDLFKLNIELNKSDDVRLLETNDKISRYYIQYAGGNLDYMDIIAPKDRQGNRQYFDYIHFFLDLIGLIPFAGQVTELINGVLYLIRRDFILALLSFIALIPLIGNIPLFTKYFIKYKRAARLLKNISRFSKSTKKKSKSVNQVNEYLKQIQQNYPNPPSDPNLQSYTQYPPSNPNPPSYPPPYPQTYV